MDKMKDVALLAGRILLALMFVMAGWGKIGGYAGTQGYMEAMGVPGFMLPLVILLELGGGLVGHFLLLGALADRARNAQGQSKHQQCQQDPAQPGGPARGRVHEGRVCGVATRPWRMRPSQVRRSPKP